MRVLPRRWDTETDRLLTGWLVRDSAVYFDGYLWAIIGCLVLGNTTSCGFCSRRTVFDLLLAVLGLELFPLLRYCDFVEFWAGGPKFDK